MVVALRTFQKMKIKLLLLQELKIYSILELVEYNPHCTSY